MDSCLCLIYDFTTYYVWQREWKRERENQNGTKRDAHEYTKIILINLANSNGDDEDEEDNKRWRERERKKRWNKLEIVYVQIRITLIQIVEYFDWLKDLFHLNIVALSFLFLLAPPSHLIACCRFIRHYKLQFIGALFVDLIDIIKAHILIDVARPLKCILTMTFDFLDFFFFSSRHVWIFCSICNAISKSFCLFTYCNIAHSSAIDVFDMECVQWMCYLEKEKWSR